MLDKLREAYWTIPYDWRPENLWYRFAGWAWRRHSTVKSRYLSHTWTDKVELIPHTVMEMLSEFIEEECSPGFVDWYSHPKTIEFGGNSWNVRDLMQHIYDWYHQVYIPKSKSDRCLEWYKFFTEHTTFNNKELWSPQWDSEENKAIHDKMFKRLHNVEAKLEDQLDEYCLMIIKIRRYMWT